MSRLNPGTIWRNAGEEGGMLSALGPGRPERPVEEWTSEEVGAAGERVAATYLQEHGLEVVDRNWTCRAGEADIVCREGDAVVLVEVKTRLALWDDDVYPELAVDEAKLETYRRIGLEYLMCHDEVDSLRLDVVAVSIKGQHTMGIRRIVGAFEWDD